MKIIGAGLAGLLAANIFQRAHVFEAGAKSQLSHRAVLRFRSRAVGEAVGIDFRPVTVHRGIWLGDKFVRPSIQLANLYSRKVIGRVMDRSIWKMEPVERYIAPENIVEQLAERCVGRISWSTPFDGHFGEEDIVSTMPMPTLLGIMDAQGIIPATKEPASQFGAQPITVRRWRVPNADVFQTIYFPDPSMALYRASITGDLLIAEYMADVCGEADRAKAYGGSDVALAEAFGLLAADSMPVALDSTRQRFGKIAPIDDAWRRQFILWATMSHRVYSLGRFATWRNILLDDVLQDISVIKRLITGGAYHAAKRV